MGHQPGLFFNRSKILVHPDTGDAAIILGYRDAEMDREGPVPQVARLTCTIQSLRTLRAQIEVAEQGLAAELRRRTLVLKKNLPEA